MVASASVARSAAQPRRPPPLDAPPRSPHPMSSIASPRLICYSWVKWKQDAVFGNTQDLGFFFNGPLGNDLLEDYFGLRMNIKHRFCLPDGHDRDAFARSYSCYLNQAVSVVCVQAMISPIQLSWLYDAMSARIQSVEPY